jgi:hypothetical protein
MTSQKIEKQIMELQKKLWNMPRGLSLEKIEGVTNEK